jgi:phage gpG-like protein
MSKKLSPQLQAALAKVKASNHIVLAQAATTAVNHFKANFKVGGFVDRGVDKWKPRKKEDKTFKKKGTKRGVLIGPGGGTLKKAIARTAISAKSATIGIKDKVVVRTNKDGTKKKVSTALYGSVHNFGLRAGRGSGFTMPKRQFIGESHKLNEKISRLIKRHVKKIL